MADVANAQVQTIERDRTFEIYEGYCPDQFCMERTIVEKTDGENSLTTCRYCAQTYPITKLTDLKKADLHSSDTLGLLRRTHALPVRDSNEWVRISGISPFHCKLISPFLTTLSHEDNSSFGRHRQATFNVSFDCKLLSDLAFAIDEIHLYSKGYGKDVSVSECYLADTLSLIAAQNDDQEVLVPLYVGGDGSCLVHAISRALVGREIYWHALRENVRRNLVENEERYKNTLGEFIADDDWTEIIKECDANYLPRDSQLGLGLRTVHIFAIANVLCRPIILLDVPENMKIGADFSATFLPIFRSVEECKDETGKLNSPLVVAWANRCHSHFVPLVAVRGSSKPKFFRSLLPKAWAAEDTEVAKYISFENDYCTVADGKLVKNDDLQALIKIVGKTFSDVYEIDPTVFCDYCETVLQKNYYMSSEIQADAARCCLAAAGGRIYRCLICWHLVEVEFLAEVFEENGQLYKYLLETEETLSDGKVYIYKDSLKLKYSKEDKRFEVVDVVMCIKCNYAAGQMRLQSLDGRILYKDGDHSRTPAPWAFCKRKMKHIWQNSEYDCPPLKLKVEGCIDDDVWSENVFIFLNESDKSRNSDLQRLSEEIVSKRIKDNKDWESSVVAICQSLKLKLNSLPPYSPKTLCCDPVWDLKNFSIKQIEENSENESTMALFYTPEFDVDSKELELAGLLTSDHSDASTDREFKTSKDESMDETHLILPVFVKEEKKESVIWFPDISYKSVLRQVCDVTNLTENEIENLVCRNSSNGDIEENFPFHPDAKSEIRVFLRK